MPDLSILCVTKAEPCVLPLLESLADDSRILGAEFVLVTDGADAFNTVVSSEFSADPDRIFRVDSKGYIESVLDKCLEFTQGEYVFRVDDDESLSLALVGWLKTGEYRNTDHWKFNRAHLWSSRGRIYDYDSVITSPPLWPDHQTRLSTREKSFGRNHIHCGSPFGGGELAPFPIIHHKLVIKSRQEREEILKRYDQVHPGAGSNFWQFSVPELSNEAHGLDTISYNEFVRRGYTV